MLVETIHTWGEELKSEGKKIGERIGEKKKALRTAQNLLALNNLTVKQIAEATELSLEEVRKIQASVPIKPVP